MQKMAFSSAAMIGVPEAAPMKQKKAGAFTPAPVASISASVTVTLKMSSLFPTLAASKTCLEAPHNGRHAVAFAFNIGNSPSMRPVQEPSMIAGNPCKYRDFKDCGSCLHAAGENDKRTRGNTIYLGSSLSSLAIFWYDCTVLSGTVISSVFMPTKTLHLCH